MAYETSTLIGLCDRDGPRLSQSADGDDHPPGMQGDHHRRGRRRDPMPTRRRRASTPQCHPRAAAGDAGRRAHADAGLEPARPDHRLRAVPLRRAGLAADDRRRHARARGRDRRARRSPAAISPSNTAHRHHQPRRARRRSTSRPTTTCWCWAIPTMLEAQPTDTRTLVTLLHLRKIAEAAGAYQRRLRDDRRAQPRTRRSRPAPTISWSATSWSA